MSRSRIPLVCYAVTFLGHPLHLFKPGERAAAMAYLRIKRKEWRGPQSLKRRPVYRLVVLREARP